MLKKYIVIGFLSVFTVLSSSAQNNDYQQQIKAGYQKFDIRDYYGAMDVFTAAIAMESSPWEAYLGRAKAYAELQQFEKALKDASKAVDEKPDKAESFILLSEIHRDLGEYELAIGNIQAALEIEPDNLIAQNQEILIQLSMGETKETSKSIDEKIKENPEFGDFYYSRGILNNAREKYDKAVEDFNQAEEMESSIDEFEININRAFANIKLENYDAALNDFTQATLLKPTNASAFHGKARANYLLDNYAEAVKDLEKAIEFNDSNPVLFYDLAMAYLRMDEINRACRNFQRSCQMGNKNACKKLLLECSSEIER